MRTAFDAVGFGSRVGVSGGGQRRNELIMECRRPLEERLVLLAVCAEERCGNGMDTSSSAAAARLVVGPAAAALAALIAELISEASAAAVANNWGCVVKYAIGPFPLRPPASLVLPPALPTPMTRPTPATAEAGGSRA